MSHAHDNVLSPSIQDVNGPLSGCHGGFREELPCQDADSHPAEPEYTPEEEEQLHARYLARLEDERRAAACVEAFAPLAEAAERVRQRLADTVYREAACLACGSVLLVEVGTGEPLCPGCALVEVA